MNDTLSFTRNSAVVVHERWRSTMASDWTDAIVISRSLRTGFSVYARKYGDTSEAVNSRRWVTFDSVKGIKEPARLVAALERCEIGLDITLNWRVTVEKLAKLDWVTASAIAMKKSLSSPGLPLQKILQTQNAYSPSQKMKVGVEWGYEFHAVEMPMSTWARICDGQEVRLRSKGMYEGERFSITWNFDLTTAASLVVSYGDDGAQGYVGSIDAAVVEGPTPFEVDICHAMLAEGNLRLAAQQMHVAEVHLKTKN